MYLILENMKIEDGMIFTYPEDNDKVILNYYTYCEVVKGAIIKYAKLSLEEATIKMGYSFLYKHPPTSYNDVEFLSHEYEYHWAMTIVYGFKYWMTRKWN